VDASAFVRAKDRSSYDTRVSVNGTPPSRSASRVGSARPLMSMYARRYVVVEDGFEHLFLFASDPPGSADARTSVFGATRDTTARALRRPCATSARRSETPRVDPTPSRIIPSPSSEKGRSKTSTACSNARFASSHCLTYSSWPTFAIFTSVSFGRDVTFTRTRSSARATEAVSFFLAADTFALDWSPSSTFSASSRNASASRQWSSHADAPRVERRASGSGSIRSPSSIAMVEKERDARDKSRASRCCYAMINDASLDERGSET